MSNCIDILYLPHHEPSEKHRRMSIVNRSVKKKNGLDIYKLRPIDCAGKTTIPAFFIHALNDELINIEVRCSLHELVPMNLFCLDDKGNLKYYL